MTPMTLSLPSGHIGSNRQQTFPTMSHCCLGSSSWGTSSRRSVRTSTLRKVTTQGHKPTGHCTSGQFKMKVSLSIQIQTRFQTPKRQGAGANLLQHTIRAQPNHQWGGSPPVSIGPQPIFANCSHIFSYTKLKMTASPYQCVFKIFCP